MAKIGRSFDELDQRIKQFNTDLKSTDAQVRALDKSLQMNPGNVDAVRQKFALLAQNLQTNAQKLAALHQKEAQLNADFQSGAISQDAYNRQLQKVRTQITATEQATEQLNKALRNQNAAISEAKFNSFISGCDKAEAGARKLSKAALVCAAAFVTLLTSAIKVGDELADNATHYGTTAENLQLWSNRLGMLGKDQDAYTKSLEKVGSVLTSITAGRGARYLTYLKQLGIAQADLNGKSNGEVFDMIYERLRGVEDATLRATIAQGIFGDTGLEIANIARTQQETLDALDEALLENGIITTEQAKAADEAANKLLALKEQASAASAELLVAAMPAFESFCSLLKETVIPIINRVADWFKSMPPGMQKLILALVATIIVLPKLITLIKGIATAVQFVKTMTYAQAAAQTTLNAATAPFLPIIIAISTALLVLISILGMFTGASNDATDSAKQMLDQLDDVDAKLAEMTGETAYNAEATYETNSQRDLNIHVDVEASGDGTEINQQNAEVVAGSIHDKILRDIVNQELGGVVR